MTGTTTSFILPAAVPHPVNWVFGWASILGGFVVGALLGLFFHREEWWGGYGSFRRRIVRLGHVAQEALGMMNILYGLSPLPAPGTALAGWAGALFVVGALTMPLVCFLSGWRKQWRHLFPVPVVALSTAVVLTLIGGLS